MSPLQIIGATALIGVVLVALARFASTGYHPGHTVLWPDGAPDKFYTPPQTQEREQAERQRMRGLVEYRATSTAGSHVVPFVARRKA